MKIGTIPTEDIGQQDAFHIPGIVLVAEEPLAPGDYVKIKNKTSAYRSERYNSHGIVDPFSGYTVQGGRKVLVLVHPRYVDGALWHSFNLVIDEIEEVDMDLQEEIEKELQADEATYDECKGCDY